MSVKSESPLEQSIPIEILAEISSYLDYKSFNNLIRTRRSIYGALVNSSKRPRHTHRIVVSIKQDNVLGISVETTFRKKIWNGSFTKTGNIAPSSTGLEQEVSNHYFANKSNHLLLERKRGLTAHLNFLLCRVHLSSLNLDSLDSNTVEEIVNQIMKHKPSVQKLYISKMTISNNTVSRLMNTCKPLGLYLNGTDCMPADFYRSPALTNLKVLVDGSVRSLMVDDDLMSLPVAAINVTGTSSVTALGIRAYLQEWAESRRDFVMLTVKLAPGVNGHNLINLIKQKLYPTLIKEGHEDHQIIRLSDGAETRIRCEYDIIQLRSAFLSSTQ